MGDAGLTGRKIIVDTYGGMARHGGGAFSGKDPSKVDRSAAYAMRWVAKNVVAAGLAERCEVQVAYAIGKAHPVGLFVETFGTGVVSDEEIQEAVARVFDLRPAAIIRDLDLLRPIYAQTAAYGHFGRPSSTSPGSRPTAPTRCARPPVSDCPSTGPARSTGSLRGRRSRAAGRTSVVTSPFRTVATGPTAKSPAAVAPVARVAVDMSLPHLDRPFDYLVPEALADAVVPGCRVRVRFAGQLVDGYRARAGRRAASTRAARRSSSRSSRAEPVLTPRSPALARAVADRWAGTLADVLRLAVPPRHAARRSGRRPVPRRRPAGRPPTPPPVLGALRRRAAAARSARCWQRRRGRSGRRCPARLAGRDRRCRRGRGRRPAPASSSCCRTRVTSPRSTPR